MVTAKITVDWCLIFYQSAAVIFSHNWKRPGESIPILLVNVSSYLKMTVKMKTHEMQGLERIS